MPGEREKARDFMNPPADWITDKGLQCAIDHGFTEAEYRAAKAVEYRIFGPYEWQNQGDRAASMMVQICSALRTARTEALEEAATIARNAFNISEPGAAMLVNAAQIISHKLEHLAAAIRAAAEERE